MKRDRRLRVGDVVRSHRRALWVGVVVDIERHHDGDICSVMVTLDRCGRPAPKATRRKLRKCHEGWLTLVSREEAQGAGK